MIKTENIDTLPDMAMIDVKTVASLMGVSTMTVWRRANDTPNFPQPMKLSARCTRWKLGDVRKMLRGGNNNV